MSAQPARAAIEEAPLLLRENVGPIAVVSFNRPATRNTLSEEVIAALHATLGEIATDQSVRALVIASEGPAFSSGHDLKQLTSHRSDADGGRGYFAKTMHACSAMMQAIVNLPKPVIAAVQGIATAAGCQLVATCDLQWPRTPRVSPPQASTTGCSARRRWWPCRAMCRASRRWKC